MSDFVSAIITTHNRRELVKCAIDSVLAQTYKNIECIVVDDASTDGTKEYLNNYILESKIKYLYINQRESKGGNHARNIGIQIANGKYVAFLDDDDEWLPHKIERQMKIVAENFDINFVYCGKIWETDFDVNSRFEDLILDSKYKSGDLSREVLIHIISTTSTILVLRQLLLDVGGFDENLNYWQEYELSIRLLQCTKVGIVRENLVLYRVVNSDKKRLSNNLAGWEKAVEYIYEKHKVLYAKLTRQQLAEREFYYCIDGINRARKVKNWIVFLKFLVKILFSPRVLKIAILKYIRKIRVVLNLSKMILVCFTL